MATKTKPKPLDLLSKAKRKEVEQKLKNALKSCWEALDGVWDPSGEGTEGFSCMADGIKTAMKNLGMEDLIDQADTEHQAVMDARESKDDVCDLCMRSNVSCERTTPCGKTIGVECKCDEQNEDGVCDNEECEDCYP